MFVLKVFTAAAVAAIAVAAPVTSDAIPAGILVNPLTRIVNQSSYGIEIFAGTPPQRMVVLVDTGSSMIGFQGTRSNWCKQKDQPCKKYGSYNNLTSTTAKFVDGDFNNGLINHGSGSDIKDTLHVGGKAVPNLVFGMITDYYASYPAPVPNSGLIGLGPFCKSKDCTKTYNTTLLERLHIKGVVKENVLGIYLGPEEPTAKGALIFGAFDRAKQRGKVAQIKAFAPLSPLSNAIPNLFNYSSFSIRTANSSNDAGNTVMSYPISKDAVALLDSGNPSMGLPTPAFHYVKNLLNITGQTDPYTGFYPVDCKYRQPLKGNPTILVGFDNDSLKIEVPVNTFVTQLGPNRCAATLSNSGSKMGKYCAFGDPFFRNIYAGFDFRTITLHLSNVNYTNKTDYYVPA